MDAALLTAAGRRPTSPRARRCSRRTPRRRIIPFCCGPRTCRTPTPRTQQNAGLSDGGTQCDRRQSRREPLALPRGGGGANRARARTPATAADGPPERSGGRPGRRSKEAKASQHLSGDGPAGQRDRRSLSKKGRTTGLAKEGVTTRAFETHFTDAHNLCVTGGSKTVRTNRGRALSSDSTLRNTRAASSRWRRGPGDVGRGVGLRGVSGRRGVGVFLRLGG